MRLNFCKKMKNIFENQSIKKTTAENKEEDKDNFSEKNKKEKFIDLMNDIDNLWSGTMIKIGKISATLGTFEIIPMLEGRLNFVKFLAGGSAWADRVFIGALDTFLKDYNFAIDRAIVEMNKKGLSTDEKVGKMLEDMVEAKEEISNKISEIKKLML